MLDTYDAGLLGNGGGGDVEWWQDYIRMLLRQSDEFYEMQHSQILTDLSTEERLRSGELTGLRVENKNLRAAGHIMERANTEYAGQFVTTTAELKELRATIAKLPQDSEGKPVVFNQAVWIVCDGNQHWLDPEQEVDRGMYCATVNSFVGDLDHMWGLMLFGADDVDWWDGPVHGTKEAAKAARENEGK